MQGLPPAHSSPNELPLTYYTAQFYDKDEADLKQVLGVLRRRIRLVGGVAVVATAAVWLWTLTRTPIYESRFQVLVEPITGNDKSQQLLDSVPVNSVNPYPFQFLSDFDYETQVEVLRSPQLLESVLKGLQKEYPEINYNQLVNNLQIARLRNTKILVVSYRNSDRQQALDVSKQLANEYLGYSLQQRQSDLRQGVQFVDEQLPVLQKRVNQLQAKLQSFRQQNELIDPESRGDELSERLNDIQKRREEAQSQLLEARSLYASLQQQLGYQPDQAIIASALSESVRYQKLLNQVQEVEAQVATESVRFQPDSFVIQALQEKRQNLLPLLREEAQKILGDRQQVAQSSGNLTETTLELNKQLINAANQLQVLQSRNQVLEAAENQLIQEFSQVPTLARQYTDLQRELKVATESLNRFLSTRESLQLDAARKAIPWQLVSPSSNPQSPIFPNVPRSLALGVVAGLLLGMGAAIFAEKLDSVFHTPTDLRNLTRFPLLGIVPFQKELGGTLQETAQQLAARTGLNLLLQQSHDSQLADSATNSTEASRLFYTASPFLEAFRSLYTNIRLLGSDSPIRSLVIGSAIPAEGKSTVAQHLAKAASALGQRVLLVDADLRRPQMHHYFGLPNLRGLSNLIAHNLVVEDVIQQSSEEENLFILTSGQIPPDPTKLLSSKKMQSLIEQFQASFDLVIYDTPPLLGLADGNLLTTHTDGIVLVVGLGKTDRSTLMMTLDRLRVTSSPILGIIANGTRSYTTNAYDYYRYYQSGTET